MTRQRRIGLLAGAAAVAAVVVLAAILISQGGADGGKGSASRQKGLFERIPQAGVTLGKPSAPATLIEFADLQCPFCAQYATATLPTVVDRYVRDGHLRLELRLLSFIGPDSVRGAQVASAAALQNKLWPYAELFYDNQGPENSGYATNQFLERLARRTPGLDVRRLAADLDSPRAAALPRQARRQADRLGVTGTPAFFIARSGGAARRLDVQSLDPGPFTQALDQALGSG